MLLEAASWLALARLTVLVVPFPRIARHLGTFTTPAEGLKHGCPLDPSPVQARLARDIGRAVRRAAHRLPFEVVCLPQAIAAKAMLRRRGIASALYFGALNDPAGKLATHAWLLAAGIEVTGYPVARDCVAVSCFV